MPLGRRASARAAVERRRVESEGVVTESLTIQEIVASVVEQLGPQIVDEFIKLKRMEWVEYSRHVSDWEIERYTEFF